MLMVKYRDKKICFTVLASLKSDHNLTPGTMVQITRHAGLFTVLSKPDKDHILPREIDLANLGVHKVVSPPGYMMFFDVVFDPQTKRHLFLFLDADGIYGLVWKKKFTVRHLKDWLNIIKID